MLGSIHSSCADYSFRMVIAGRIPLEIAANFGLESAARLASCDRTHFGSQTAFSACFSVERNKRRNS